MTNWLIDSSIIIDHFRGRPQARDFLDEQRLTGHLSTHIVVVAEVLTGARNMKEQELILQFFADFVVHSSNESDCQASLELLAEHRLPHGAGWHDCLIAATALRLDCGVATGNERHFQPIADLQVHRPF